MRAFAPPARYCLRRSRRSVAKASGLCREARKVRLSCCLVWALERRHERGCGGYINQSSFTSPAIRQSSHGFEFSECMRLLSSVCQGIRRPVCYSPHVRVRPSRRSSIAKRRHDLASTVPHTRSTAVGQRLTFTHHQKMTSSQF